MTNGLHQKHRKSSGSAEISRVFPQKLSLSISLHIPPLIVFVYKGIVFQIANKREKPISDWSGTPTGTLSHLNIRELVGIEGSMIAHFTNVAISDHT
jgi:hypothetical protein